MVARILEDSLMAVSIPILFCITSLPVGCKFSMVKVLVLDLELEHQL